MEYRLYSQCKTQLHQQVSVRLADGRNYMGTIQKVTPEGVYLSSQQSMRTHSNRKQNVNSFTTAVLSKDQKLDVEEVFFGVFFFPFAVGFTLGFIAGEKIAHFPPHPHTCCPIRGDIW